MSEGRGNDFEYAAAEARCVVVAQSTARASGIDGDSTKEGEVPEEVEVGCL